MENCRVYPDYEQMMFFRLKNKGDSEVQLVAVDIQGHEIPNGIILTIDPWGMLIHNDLSKDVLLPKTPKGYPCNEPANGQKTRMDESAARAEARKVK